jgi:hypothetical protein
MVRSSPSENPVIPNSHVRFLSAVLPLAVLLAVAAPASVEAQDRPDRGQGTQITALAGATFSSLRGVDGLDSRTGTLVGVSFLFPFMGPLSLQPEALVVGRGAQSEFREGLDLSYFEVPLLLRLSLTPRSSVTPHLYAGPYLGIQIDCSVDGSSASCDDLPDVSTNTVDVGGVVGGGANLLAGPLLLTGGLRYGFGVSTLAEFDTGTAREEAKNGSWAIYVGAGIRLGGR